MKGFLCRIGLHNWSMLRIRPIAGFDLALRPRDGAEGYMRCRQCGRLKSLFAESFYERWREDWPGMGGANWSEITRGARAGAAGKETGRGA
jgi:hypothetical protein